jgi:NCS1 family nucleobase:cation symporter-1
MASATQRRLTTDLEIEQHEGWNAGSVEQRGIEHVPTDERGLSARGLAGLWGGSQLNISYIVFGLLVASFGMPLWQTAAVILIGNLSYILTGLVSLQGPEAGTTALVINRAPFGHNANRFVGILNWATMIGYEVLDIYLAVIIAASLFSIGDVTHLSFPVQLLMVVLAAGIQVLLPLLGHATITTVMSKLVVPFVVLFGVMAVLVLRHTSFPTHDGSLSTFTLALAVIVSAGGLGWVSQANDFSRYLPSHTSRRSTVLSVLIGAGIPTVLLELLGACAFSLSKGAFTVVGVADSFSDWFRIPFLAFALVQVWCTGALVVYSSGVTVQAIGLPIKRWVATLIDAVVGTAVTMFVITDGNFYAKLSGFVLYAIVWLAPWAGVFLADWFLRRGRYDARDLLRERGGRYWHSGGVHWPGIIALLAGMGATLMWLDASTAFPSFTGPISQSLSGSDLSWLIGFVVGGGCYLLLASASVRAEAELPAGEPVAAVPATPVAAGAPA